MDRLSRNVATFSPGDSTPANSANSSNSSNFSSDSNSSNSSEVFSSVPEEFDPALDAWVRVRR